MRLFYYRDELLYCHHSRDESPRSEDFKMHAHDMLEIYCFLSGGGSYLVEGVEYPLKPRDVMIMRAAETHKLGLRSGEPYERIALHFSPALLADLDPEGRMLAPFTERPLGRGNRFPAGSFPAGRFAACFGDFDRPDQPPWRLRLHALSRLLAVLGELADAGDRRSPGSGDGVDFAASVVGYVNAHLFGELSLDAVSREFFMSKSQLERVFRRATGSPLWEYVQIKRLLSARERIASGQSASDAAADCGFCDYSAFYRAYRAHFGHSPRQDAPRA